MEFLLDGKTSYSSLSSSVAQSLRYHTIVFTIVFTTPPSIEGKSKTNLYCIRSLIFTSGKNNQLKHSDCFVLLDDLFEYVPTTNHLTVN